MYLLFSFTIVQFLHALIVSKLFKYTTVSAKSSLFLIDTKIVFCRA